MPYRVVKRGTKFVVEKRDGSKSFGAHDTREEANKQMAAMYANEPRAMRQLHLLGATGAPRVEQYDGREHLVLPVTALIGDNVIHAVNAERPEFVPASVLSSNGWDGRPLVLGHPTEGGRQVSANDPRVMERQGFGFMAKSHMNGKRLGTEAWIDVAKLEKLGQAKMLEDLRAGRPLEVSVGAFVQTRERPGVAPNGRRYSTEWATIAPDHLAFLPNSVGACSLEMGCGANRAAMRVMEGSDELRDASNPEGINQYTAGSSASHAAASEAHSAAVEAHEKAAKATKLSGSLRTKEAQDASEKASLASEAAGHERGQELADRAGNHADNAFRAIDHGNRSLAIEYHDRAAALHDRAATFHDHAAKAAKLKGLSMERSIIDPETLRCLRDIPQSVRDEMSASDFAGPDETYPIKTQADVDAAKHLIGKAADPEAVKRKVIAIAKRKGLAIPDAWKERAASMSLKKLKKRVLALFDTPEQAASEEAAELIAYKSMRALFDATGDQWDEASQLIDDLIADEEDDPTTTPAGEDAEEEVEDARLDAIRMLCYSMMSALQSVVSATVDQQQPEMPAMESPRYAAALRAAVGRSISAANARIIQAAHDASHETHAHTVALGAQCDGMKALAQGTGGGTLEELGLKVKDGDEVDIEVAAAGGNPEFRAACGCEGEAMLKRTESVQGILRAAAAAAGKTLEQYQKSDGFTEDQVKGLNMLPEKTLEALHTLAGKSPADSIIQAKAAADAALAGHAHGLNMKDEAEKAAAAKADAEKNGDKKLKAAQDAGFKTVAEHEEAEFLRAHPALKALVDRQKEHEEVHRGELIGVLKTAGSLTEEQLKAKSVEELETLASFAKVELRDYSGRGIATLSAGEKDVFLNPPDPYAEGIKARKAAAAVNS